ncbi:MAG: hypothetical protein D6732_24800 [Methanobacteriota archaeon]|nr:MAG: hypothetical protein D6732_24800 [Euryarchaeota archaeon]
MTKTSFRNELFKLLDLILHPPSPSGPESEKYMEELQQQAKKILSMIGKKPISLIEDAENEISRKDKESLYRSIGEVIQKYNAFLTEAQATSAAILLGGIDDPGDFGVGPVSKDIMSKIRTGLLGIEVLYNRKSSEFVERIINIYLTDSTGRIKNVTISHEIRLIDIPQSIRSEMINEETSIKYLLYPNKEE